jgi:NaMN:DMB phosphoribosyltransferase
MRSVLGFLMLLMVAGVLLGYSHRTVVLGNLTSMAAVIGLFYSTINLKKS